MKPWNRIGLRPAIGLAIEDQQISLSVVATTPGGRKEVVRDVQSCADEPQETVLERMLAPWLGKPRDPLQKTSGKSKHARRPWVQVALPESRVFQAVVPITGANRSSPPQAYFMEAVQATNLRAEERVIDLVKLEMDKQPLACLAASPRPVITGLIAMLEGIGTRVALIESAPAGLFRAGAFLKKAPRGSKLCIRFFLGRTQAIGVLALGMQPVLWHTFDLPAEDVLAAIMATYSTLWMQGRHCRIRVPIDTVVVHGRPELELAIKPEMFRERTGAACSAAASRVTNRSVRHWERLWPILSRIRTGSTWRAGSNRRCQSGRSSPGASWPSRRLWSRGCRCFFMPAPLNSKLN